MNTDLEKRIQKLEKQNRWLNIVLVGVLVSVLVVGVGGAGKGIPEELVAKKLRIVDESGNNVAGITFSEGGAGLVLLDEDGNTRVSLHAKRNVPSLSLFGEDGDRSQLVLGLTDKQSSLLFVNDAGQVCFRAIGNEKQAGLGVYTAGGINQAWLGTDENGGLLTMADTNGKARILAGMPSDKPGVVVYSRDGEPVDAVMAP